jgi:hypothetical protein
LGCSIIQELPFMSLLGILLAIGVRGRDHFRTAVVAPGASLRGR